MTADSATWQLEPENFRRTFTLLVPSVHTDRGTPIDFTTFGFATIVRDSLGGPRQVRGVVQTYAKHDLSGVAEVLDFLTVERTNVAGLGDEPGDAAV